MSFLLPSQDGCVQGNRKPRAPPAQQCLLGDTCPKDVAASCSPGTTPS